MRLFRTVLLGLVCLALAAMLAGLLLQVPAIQTRLARHLLAREGVAGVELGRVAVSRGRVTLRHLQIARPGFHAHVPEVIAEVPVLRALRGRVEIARLEARGWSVDLVDAPVSSPGQSPGTGAPPAASFAGVLSSLRLPPALAVDRVDIAGEVRLPGASAAPVVWSLAVSGGGLGAGREAEFLVSADAAVSGALSSLRISGRIGARVDAGSSIDRVAAVLDAVAAGDAAPAGARLRLEGGAEIGEAGAENYRFVLANPERRLLGGRAELPPGGDRITGEIDLAMQDADLAPFTLGFALPEFVAQGSAEFVVDTRFERVAAKGRLELALPKPGMLRPELSAVGPLALDGSFAAAITEGFVQIDALRASLGDGRTTVLRVDVRQPMGLALESGELRVADPSQELCSIEFDGVPTGWLEAGLPGLGLVGGSLRGRLLAGAADGGFNVRSETPLTVSAVSVSRRARPLLREVEASVSFSADVTPAGWQAAVREARVFGSEGTLLAMSGRVGRARGTDSPLKVLATFSGSLPALLAQPAVARAGVMRAGDFAGEFTLSRGTRTESAWRLGVTDAVAGQGSSLPAVRLEGRLDLERDGRAAVRMPIELERSGRRTEVTVAAAARTAAGTRVIDASIAGVRLHLDDLGALAAPFLAPETGVAPPAPAAGVVPFWSGMAGTIDLRFGEVVLPRGIAVREVIGRFGVDEKMLTLESLRGQLGTGGTLEARGGVRYVAADANPYTLRAHLTGSGIDAAGLLRALSASVGAPVVDARVDLSGEWASSARDLRELAGGAWGDVRVASRGGVLRLVPDGYLEGFGTVRGEFARRAEQTGTLGSIAEAISSRLPAALGGGAPRNQQVAERLGQLESLLRLLAEIRFDQLTLELGSNARLDTVIRDVTVTAPELRLVGSGELRREPGQPAWRRPLALALDGRVRGRVAESLRRVNPGLLAESPDSLGYLPLSFPLAVSGSIEDRDAAALVSTLVEKVLALQLPAGDLERLRRGDVAPVVAVLGQPR